MLGRALGDMQVRGWIQVVRAVHHTLTVSHKEAHKQTIKQTKEQTNKQTSRQTDKQTNKQTNK
jgi:hypothetical protein